MSNAQTPLGHAAIVAQYPEYVARAASDTYTGRSYAEEYLLPLAKTDLLFDDIHFLSPVSDVSRYRTLITDDIDPQERCNDEFRILVEGRHRGPWSSRADVVLDCRGATQSRSGMGPGGGLAIGETTLRESFLLHTPQDRKFEAKSIAGKHVCLVGQSTKAALFATEFLQEFGQEASCRLTWVIRPDRRHDTSTITNALNLLRASSSSNVVVFESLGVEQIQRNEAGQYLLKFLKDDESTVEMQCDAVSSMTAGRVANLSSELNESRLDENADTPRWQTQEPGYYVLRGGSLDDGAGVGLSDAFQCIRQLFALLAGRDDLDLYDIISKQKSDSGR